MRRTRKLFMVSVGCAGIVMTLLLTAVLTTHLLANRDMVKTFIVAKTAQATGGILVYDRLDIGFLPMPHLKARNIHLRRADTFAVDAQELSIYPRILPMLRGRIKVRRLALVSPGIDIKMKPNPLKTKGLPTGKGGRSLKDNLSAAIGGLFGVLGAIDPGTDLRVEDGVVNLAFTDAPDLRIGGINGFAENNDGGLSLDLSCRSDLTGKIDVRASADMAAMKVSGQATLTGMNVRPLLFYASIPGGITAEDTRASINTTFTVDGPDTVNGRFDLQFPSLTVMRKGRRLHLEEAGVTGSVDLAGNRLVVSVETLQSVQPALNLSASASINPGGRAGQSVVEFHAAAGSLDVGTAGTVTRAIAGDLDEIQTAFSVAKAGQITNAAYFAGFKTGRDGLQLTRMKASGHLAQGRVTIPGIGADLEGMQGDVIYEDRQVAFENVSGFFKGARFKKLNAAIDWEKKSTLSIASTSVDVDIEPLFTWLTAFEGMSGAKNYVESFAGSGRITHLNIDGPLAEPQNWSFEIKGIPEDIRLESPLAPFEVRLSGGEIDYLPGKERAKDVRIEFLDGSVVSSYQSQGIVNPERLTFSVDGSMGQAAIDWLSTMLPIPKHLQMKPPLDLSDVKISWDHTRTLSFTGAMKTAGGVALVADVTVSPQDWHVRQIQFADGISQATMTARKHATGMEIGFSGNLEKETADRILETNQILSGRMEGDFRAEIDTRTPLKSSFSGKLEGEGVHLRGLVSDPIDVKHFSIDGSGDQLKIAPSAVSLCNSLLVVDGVLDRIDGALSFDLNIDADRLDEELIRTFQPTDKDQTGTAEKPAAASAIVPRGAVHVKANDVTYGGVTWSRVQASVRLDGEHTQVQIDQADLCGISTTGELAFSPRGVSLHVTPAAIGTSFQETVTCLWDRPVKAVAQYDLSGEINLPPTREDPVRLMSGQMEFQSQNGRIHYASSLMKIFSVLNVTEVFTRGKSDLTEEGYGYTNAYATAEIGGGKIQFKEILLDGNSLKITGQGSIDLNDATVDIILLAAPLKTVDRIVNNLPIIRYIAGGSLISIPLRVEGKLRDISVVPLPPSAVGKGLLNIMGRTLKAPFKLVEGAAELTSAGSAEPVDTSQKGP
jgi:hypothetical protein